MTQESSESKMNNGEKFVSLHRDLIVPGVFYALTESAKVWMFASTGPLRKGIPIGNDGDMFLSGKPRMAEGAWATAGLPDRAPRLVDVVAELAPKARTMSPIPENPVAAVEDELRVSTLEQAKSAVMKLAALLDGPPAGAARALHLIGETATVYGEMLTAIGLPGVGRKRNHGLVGQYVASASLNDSLGAMETSPGGETFGNQAMSQFNAGLKQIAELMAGRKDKPSKPKGPTAFDIESLTRAYANAKRDNLEPEIVVKLKSRLEEALAAQEWGPPSGLDGEDLSDPIPVAPLLQGVALGLAGGTGMPITDEEAGAVGSAPEDPT